MIISSIPKPRVGVVLFRLVFFVWLVLLFTFSATAQYPGTKFTDISGAELAEDSKDLDVGYVPTPIAVVNKILEVSDIGPKDFLIDLGSGDGRIVITAAQKFGTQGLGVDLNAKLVELSKQYAVEEGVAQQTDFMVRNIFMTDIYKADVITMYLLPEVNLKLRPKLLNELKPGTRIVSHNYHLGEWRPDKTVLMENASMDGDSIIYFWIVPAKVDGSWHWSLDLRGEKQYFDLTLKQTFQDVSGEVFRQHDRWPIFGATIKGDRIHFSLASEADGRIIRQDYKGKVIGKAISGTVRLSGATERKELQWKALRSERPVKF